MLRNNMLVAFIVTAVAFVLVADNEVHAEPEPCKELLDLVIKPAKIRKPKQDDKENNDRHKRRKENAKQFRKILEMLMQKPKKEPEEIEVTKPKGTFEDMMTSYMDFVKYLMLL